MSLFTIRCSACGAYVSARKRQTASGERYYTCACGQEAIVRGPQHEYREFTTKAPDVNLPAANFSDRIKP